MAILARIATGLSLIIASYLSLTATNQWWFTALMLSILSIILLTEWPRLLRTQSWYWWLLTPLYPIAPFLLLINLHHTGFDPLIVALFIVVFTFDTASFVAGKLWGTHAIAPHISPGKTWEGFAGGYLATCAVATLLKRTALSPIYLYAVLLAICAIALCGDLFESYLKRRAGLKDSGWLLPGHGGFLDRFDSLLFVAVMAYALRYKIQVLLM